MLRSQNTNLSQTLKYFSLLFFFFFCLVYYLHPKRVGSEPKLGQSCVLSQRAIPVVYQQGFSMLGAGLISRLKHRQSITDRIPYPPGPNSPTQLSSGCQSSDQYGRVCHFCLASIGQNNPQLIEHRRNISKTEVTIQNCSESSDGTQPESNIKFKCGIKKTSNTSVYG